MSDQPVADFCLPAAGTDTAEIRSADLAGQPYVLFFYPRDDTSGCTREAQDFTALGPEFDAIGVRVFGVSRDTLASHEKFIAKKALGVPLLSDAESDLSERFGVWKEKSMYGRKFMGIERSTFLIDGRGRIVREWRKVKVPGHAQEVLEAARAL